MDTLTKAQLVELVRRRVGLTKKEGAVMVDEVFSLMRNALADGEMVKVSGFGKFVVRDKSARKGRNPQTNEEIIIARRRVMTFKPSQVLRSTLNPES